MERWVLLRKGADFQEIGDRFHISPRLACLIRNRDIIGEEKINQFLNGTISDLYDGMLMKDMGKAVEILMEKLKEKKKIRVIGDYDIDGVSATYILLEGLEGLGADADMDIPDRILDGYGLNRTLIERAGQAHVDTIITCDNGIAAMDEIEYAKRLGMTVIVTDHHEVPYTEEEGRRKYHLPPADAVVNPKRADCIYPFKGLCGAAVAYKLMEALYEAMGEDAADIDYLLEFVGIATVGDVMDLIDENRIFVKQALEMIPHTGNMGLRSLMNCTGVDSDTVTSYHIGYVIGPCMNVGGRLDTAKRTLELLRAKRKKDADILAGDLKALNDSRKELTERAVAEAVSQVEETPIGKDRVLVIHLPECHESLAGIVAGRIREYYYRPCLVLTGEGEILKGSGRSVESYSLYEGLNRCEEYLLQFGGHRLAAGLTMEAECLGEFRRAINDRCGLSEEDLQEKVVIDMELPFSCVTENLIREIALLEPFGKGNARPVFAVRDIKVLSCRIIGKNKNILKLQLEDRQGIRIEGMYFGKTEEFLSRIDEGRIAITYYPKLNEYMGRKTIQIVITHYK